MQLKQLVVSNRALLLVIPNTFCSFRIVDSFHQVQFIVTYQWAGMQPTIFKYIAT